jgi:hypothetical protein
MPASTSPDGFPYPELNDGPNGPSQIQALATQIQSKYTALVNAIAAINGLAAASALTTTDEGPSSSTTFIPGTTVVGTTFVAPPSGDVLVILSAYIEQSGGGNVAVCSWTMRSGGSIGSGTAVPGASASTDRGVLAGQAVNSGAPAIAGNSHITRVSGLTPGNTYNVRVEFCTTPAGAITVRNRAIIVQPLL